jgi:hypothetical protein
VQVEGVNPELKEDTKMLYCIYCGEEEKNGHYEKCPIVDGIPEAIMGLKPIKGDHEYNLNLGRIAVQWYYMQSKSKKIKMLLKRIDYELIAMSVRHYLLKHGLSESKGILKKWKNWKKDKAYDELIERAKEFDISTTQLTKMFNQKLLLANHSSFTSVPVYRNDETKELIYQDVN